MDLKVKQSWEIYFDKFPSHILNKISSTPGSISSTPLTNILQVWLTCFLYLEAVTGIYQLYQDYPIKITIFNKPSCILELCKMQVHKNSSKMTPEGRRHSTGVPFLTEV